MKIDHKLATTSEEFLELMSTVYHEAGHALLTLENSNHKLRKKGVSLIPSKKNDSLAATYIRPRNKILRKLTKNLITFKREKLNNLLNNICMQNLQISLAGKITEKFIIDSFKSSDYASAKTDIKNILEILDDLDIDDPKEKKKILENETKNVIKIIINNYEIIHLIAVVCLIKPKYNKNEINFVYQFKKLPTEIENKIKLDANIKNFFNFRFDDKIVLNHENLSFKDIFYHEIQKNDALLILYPETKETLNIFQEQKEKLNKLEEVNKLKQLQAEKKYNQAYNSSSI